MLSYPIKKDIIIMKNKADILKIENSELQSEESKYKKLNSELKNNNEKLVQLKSRIPSDIKDSELLNILRDNILSYSNINDIVFYDKIKKSYINIIPVKISFNTSPEKLKLIAYNLSRSKYYNSIESLKINMNQNECADHDNSLLVDMDLIFYEKCRN